MGKYIRKSRNTALMDVSVHAQSSLGVSTRAKTLALRRSSSAQPTSPAGGSYLELRSRRLEKPPILVFSRRDSRYRKKGSPVCLRNPSSRGESSPRTSSRSKSSGSVSLAALGRDRCSLDSEAKAAEVVEGQNVVENDSEEKSGDVGVEASFGDNVLEFDAQQRSTRETTPCSLIRNPESITTPGSTTGPSCTRQVSGIEQNSTRRSIPTSNEMNAFFAGTEEEQRKKFIEKYNFDPVKDLPLPGRYEWQKLDPQ